MIALTSLLLFLFITLFVYWIKYRWRNRKFFELAKKLPGHDGFSFIESIKILEATRTDNYNLFNKFFKEDLPISKLFVFNYLIITTQDADVIHQILNIPQTYDKPEVFYNSLPIKKGVIVLNGNEHKRHRKILNKAFVPKMLERLPDIFRRVTEKMITKLSEKVDCGEFNILEYTGAYSLEAIGTSNFCYETKYFKSEFHDANESLAILMIESMIYYFMGFNHKTIGWTKLGREMSKIFKTFHDFFYSVEKNYNETKNPEKNTVIDLLLDPANEFTDLDKMDEYKTIVFAAFDTTSKSLATTLMLLGMHKEVQQKLIDEIDSIYNECIDNINFDLDFVNKFKYLEAVINESLRLFSVAPYSAREFTEDVDISGHLIPKGAFIIISYDRMHRDEKYWGTDAHVFRPERFLEELKYPKAFKPFSGGRRICIGYRYAMISMKTFLINFFRSYKVNCSTKLEDIKIEVTITLNFASGYNVSIEKRN